jgi:hypothetical protein
MTKTKVLAKLVSEATALQAVEVSLQARIL